MVNTDPVFSSLVLLAFFALLIGIVLKYYKLPSVISYIITGIVLGPYGFHVLSDVDFITSLGNFGVVLLLFFIGMEVSLEKLIKHWKIAVIGTFFQIVISVLAVWGLGAYLGWPIERIILIGFVISLSSTAVVINILELKKELQSNIGQDVLSILLVQDIAVIPMIIALSFLGGDGLDVSQIILQVIGATLAIGFVIYLISRKEVRLPFASKYENDAELQVLAAFIICFGVAVLSGFFQLSTALGAFIGGLFLGRTRETKWVHHTLYPFKVLFLALFFISIGMLIDMTFFVEHTGQILFLLFFVYLTNTLINALIFKFGKRSWSESFYGGAVLSQIGEFSFILVALGLTQGIISNYAYQMTVQTIAFSLMISPMWVGLFKRFIVSSTVIKEKVVRKLRKRKIKVNDGVVSYK